MNHYLLAALLCLAPASVFAWQFTAPISVSELDNGVHHMQTATARALAVSNDAVALVWEDNHDGTPAVYFSIKLFAQNRFSAPRRLSADQPSFEPTITSDGTRFVVLWESAAHIHGSVCDPTACSAATQISSTPARQVSLTHDGNGKIFFVWSARRQTVYQLQTGEIEITNKAPKVHALVNVTPMPTQAQSYPSLSALPQGLTVAFEDREQGHTRLMTAFRPAGKEFLAPQALNDLPSTHDTKYGAGTGAMRAQLADDGQANVAVVWLDKRDFEGAYDVYAAVSNDAGKSFGADEKAQDPLGDNQPQWHANIAISRQGRLISAWSDPRDGTLDIWYSTRTADGWSDDEPLPISRGGDQTHPALAFDANDVLHIAFVDQQIENKKKKSRIYYLTARP